MSILSNISCFLGDFDNQDSSGDVKPWEDQNSRQDPVSEMGVTYRAFGSPLHIWIKGGVIFTDRGILEDMTNLSSVKLYTSRKKNWNIFSSYKQEATPHQKVIIRHLAP